MSNPSSPGKSSIGLTGQQGRGFQGESSGSRSSTSKSSSGSSNSNAKQSSIVQANGTGGNAPAAITGAWAMVNLNRSIQTPKLYHPKKDGYFKTWLRHLEHYFTLLNVGDEKKRLCCCIIRGTKPPILLFT